MKKTAIPTILLLCIFLITAQAQSVFGQKRSINPVPTAASIEYNVLIHLGQEQTYCGNYLVMITDANGNMVAPAVPYVEGVTLYSISELGYSFVGTRTAKMIASPTLDPICDQLLTADPASLFTLFLPGVNYEFNLYPKVEAQHE